jgi:hypothetical protein
MRSLGSTSRRQARSFCSRTGVGDPTGPSSMHSKQDAAVGIPCGQAISFLSVRESGPGRVFRSGGGACSSRPVCTRLSRIRGRSRIPLALTPIQAPARLRASSVFPSVVRVLSTLPVSRWVDPNEMRVRRRRIAVDAATYRAARTRGGIGAEIADAGVHWVLRLSLRFRRL